MADRDSFPTLPKFTADAKAWLDALSYSTGLRRRSEAASLLLGPSLAADTGQWGTFAWSEWPQNANPLLFVTHLGMPLEALVSLVITFNEGVILERLSGIETGHATLLDWIEEWMEAKEKEWRRRKT